MIVLHLNAHGMTLMGTTQFSMRISDELKQSLENISKITNRSQSQLASMAIADYVKRMEWKLKAIQIGKKEADKGDFVSQEAVIQWLETWGNQDESQAPESLMLKENTDNVIVTGMPLSEENNTAKLSSESEDEFLENLLNKLDSNEH